MTTKESYCPQCNRKLIDNDLYCFRCDKSFRQLVGEMTPKDVVV